VFLSKLLFRARSRDLWKTVALAFAILLAEATALAQTDEIQEPSLQGGRRRLASVFWTTA